MDAKNSPLALLAQTCSAIGADSPNPKLLANIENATKTHKSYECHDKSSPGSQSSISSNHSNDGQQKSSFKPYDASTRNKLINPTIIDEHQQQQQQQHQRTLSTSSSSCSSAVRTKTPKSINLSIGGSSSSPRITPPSFQLHRKTPSGNGGASEHRHTSSPNYSQHNKQNKDPLTSCSTSNASITSANSSSSVAKTITTSSAQLNNTTDVNTKDLLAGNISKTMPPTSSVSSFFNGFPPTGLPYSMDLMTASALMSPHHQSMLKQATLNPYFNYARNKGNELLGSPQLCRDPYCTGCPYSAHKPGQPTCPAGCLQCDHPKTSTGYPISNSTASSVSAAFDAAYARAQLAAIAASQMYYTCNWVGSDTAYCGKRFATSDELFQHLRTHTGAIPDSLLTTASGLPAAASALYQRTYPTPPLSPLSSSRYHPYSKAMLPPSALAASQLAGLPFPPPPLSLAQYFSPYGFYGRNPSSMHP